MPSKKQYNLVTDDAYDSRIPLYNEEAFQHGITFHAKYIGSLDVPRPSSRIEIVAAMRRIRYEFKAKSMKKKKVNIIVSVDGVKVNLRSKRRTNQWPWDDNKFIILHHPIYRIFYVSHDSQDLKIFSYIARDGGTNAFKCNVFKSKKKSQAMRIVRTIGQAFEVCHKLSLALATTSGSGGANDEIDDSNLHDHANKGKCQGDGASEPNSCDTQEEASGTKALDSPPHSCLQRPNGNNLNLKENSEVFKATGSNSAISESLSVQHHIQMLKEQLEQQNQQMQSVVGQVQLLKDQLSAETTARLEAQAQNHHLLAHNRELLEHIKKLVNHVHEIEEKFHKSGKVDKASTADHSATSDMEKYLQNARYQISMTSIGKQPTDENVPSESSFLRNYSTSLGRQLSTPSTAHHGSSSSSPKFGVSFNNSGISLPGSPSQYNFSSNMDSLFKPNTFVCSSPKLPRKGKSAGQVSDEISTEALSRSPSFSQSSTSPGHYGSKKQQVFDFEPVSYSSSSLFSPDRYNQKFYLDNSKNETQLGLNSGALSQASVHYNSSEPSSTTESFIAQVTRDLAKMTAAERGFSDSASPKPIMDTGFSSLFKS